MSGLVQADDGFGEGVVVGIADRSDRWCDPGFGETVDVLRMDRY